MVVVSSPSLSVQLWDTINCTSGLGLQPGPTITVSITKSQLNPTRHINKHCTCLDVDDISVYVMCVVANMQTNVSLLIPKYMKKTDVKVKS